MPFEFFAAALAVGQAVAVGGDHGNRFRLQQHESAVQRVTRFFTRYGKPGAGDQTAQDLAGNLEQRQRWEMPAGWGNWISPCQPSWCWSAAADADPMIVEQLDGDVGVGQELYVVVEFARGDGAGSFLFYFGVTRSAQTEIEVGGGER